ncbi:MAG: hypothetical protein K2G31_04470 [Clostridia bacterium]|nr:hypothetical protein [Clostridia bacterium]
MEVSIINKETGEILFHDLDEFLEMEEADILDENKGYALYNNLYVDTIFDMWDRYKKPFVAQHSTGFYVLISQNPYEQYSKYNGTWGRMNNNIAYLLTYNNWEEIYMPSYRQWRFVALCKDLLKTSNKR